MTKQFSETVLEMAEVLDKKNAEDIMLIDIRDVSVIADCFLICSGKAPNHVKMLADELSEEMAKRGVFMKRMEGYSEGRWIVLDFGDVLVHVFHRDEREFYSIERLWRTDENWMDYPADKKSGD